MICFCKRQIDKNPNKRIKKTKLECFAGMNLCQFTFSHQVCFRSVENETENRVGFLIAFLGIQCMFNELGI